MRQQIESNDLARTEFLQALARGLRPVEPLSVSEWSDKHRYLSNTASAEPGLWRTDRTPYLREIMDCLSVESPVTKVVFSKGSQIGATECINNFIGYVIDHAPGPMLSVMPTEDMAKRNSATRIQPMIEATPVLRNRLPKARSRDSQNSILKKQFPGGVLVMVGANSPAPLRSMPARFLALDELSGYPGDVGGEGDPVALAEARTATYGANKKLFYPSTPTIEGRCRVTREFENSDQRYFNVPCPHCDHYQVIKLERIKWMPDTDPKRAALVCEECGVFIEERHKTTMLAKGKWVPTNDEGRWRGYHLSSLYSPLGWYSWSDALEEWFLCQKDVTRLKTFVNTKLGEPWRDKGEAPDWEKVMGRAEDYPIGDVPKTALVLVSGVDVQKDRLECEVVGYGPDNESWSVDYIVIQGDTSGDECWAELTRVLNRDWPREGGGYMKIRRMSVDSGYNTQRVYAWCRSQSADRVIAVKGSDSARVAISASNAEVTAKGKTNRKGLRLWTVASSLLKQELYGWLKQDLPEENAVLPSGWCHFPKYSREFFKMLCAEEMVLKTTGGRSRYIWEKVYDRNESLDTRVYARAAAISIGIDRWNESNWSDLRRDYSLKPVPVESARPSTGGIRRKKGSGFW